MTIYRLTRRIKFPNHWPTAGVKSYENPLERLSPTPYTFENLSSSHHFNSAENVYVGQARWSQVYAGSLVSPSSPSIRGLKLDDVILKVYSTAFFPYPNADPDVEITPPENSSANSYRLTDELMAWAEVHAYSELFSLQGKLIPHFIDAFMVKSPNSDEESIGIAMSRIHGKSFTERCQELGSEIDGDTRWFSIALELFRKVYEIHQLGIIGLDIRGPNVRVVGNPTKPDSSRFSESVMLFDFASARPSSFPTEEEQIHHRVKSFRVHDLSLLTDILLTVCGDSVDGPVVGTPSNRVRAFMRWVRDECTNEPWFEDWWSVYFHKLRIQVDI